MTSVSDVLTLPWSEFDRQIAKMPELIPTMEQLDQLEQMLK